MADSVVRVSFIGNAGSLKKATAEASAATAGMSSKINAHTSGMSKAFGKVDTAMHRSGDFIRKWAKFAVVGFAAGAVGLGVLAAKFIKEARDVAKIQRLTNAVIKSTGGVAKVTAQHVRDLSVKLSNLSGVDDDLIASSENVLLTFTGIRNELGKGNDIFDQAQQSILDVSAALGQDLQKTTIQVGKALNDPIKGMTALRRIGVSFTDAQVKQVKALVKAGKTMQAQKLILRELKTEFGGAAKAASDPWKRLGVVIQNAAETIGLALLPVLEPLVNWLGDVIPTAIDTTIRWFYLLKLAIEAGFQNPMADLGKDAPNWWKIFVTIGQWARHVYDWFAVTIPKAIAIFKDVFNEALAGGRKLIDDLANAFGVDQKTILIAIGAIGAGLIGLAIAWNLGPGLILTGIVVLVAGFLYLYNHFEAVRKGVQYGLAALTVAFRVQFAFIEGVVYGFLGVVQLIQVVWGQVTNAIETGFYAIAGVFEALWAVAGPPLRALADILQRIWDLIQHLKNLGGGGGITIPGTHQQIPHIPGLGIPFTASGGIVTHAQARIVGEAGPEAIIPLSQFDDVVGNRGGGSVTNNVTIHVHGGDPAQVVDALKRYVRNNGPVKGIAA